MYIFLIVSYTNKAVLEYSSARIFIYS